VVHNTYLFDYPQKSVLIAPWTYYPRPLWSAGQQNLEAALPYAFGWVATGVEEEAFGRTAVNATLKPKHCTLMVQTCELVKPISIMLMHIPRLLSQLKVPCWL
jgi:hypothetical protein